LNCVGNKQRHTLVAGTIHTHEVLEKFEGSQCEGYGQATLADGKAHADSNGGTDSTKREKLLTDIEAPGTGGDRLFAAGLDFCS